MKKIPSMIKLGLISSVIAIGMNGCIPAPASSVQEKAVGTLSFKYDFGQKKARVNK